MTASSAHAPADAGRPINMGTRAGRPVACGLDCPRARIAQECRTRVYVSQAGSLHVTRAAQQIDRVAGGLTTSTG